MSALALQMLPIGSIHESPLNPRKHYDAAAIEQLADSLRKVGVLNALTARPRKVGGGYELAAGHRRLRAAKIAKMAEVPVNVREMDDATFIEVMTIDNLQRDDLHPLEEAQGFRSLMEKSIGYDVAKIADRVGRSAGYVYDRLRLLQLTPKAQDLFLAKRFTLAHAVLLSRLNAEQQEKAIEIRGDGLFRIEHTRQYELEGEDSEDDYANTKPCSVREFSDWIDRHVRLDLEAEDIPTLFPALSQQLALADTSAAKVLEISLESQLHPDAKSSSRTLGPQSWRRAEKPCKSQALGVVVAGIRRGESFMICTDKKKCTTHWGSEIRAAAALEKAKLTGSKTAVETAQRTVTSNEDRWKKEMEERRRYDEAVPAMVAALSAAIRKAPTGPKSAVGLLLTEEFRQELDCDYYADDTMWTAKNDADLVRLTALMLVVRSIDNSYAAKSGAKVAKQFGVDIMKIVKDLAAAEKRAAEKPAQAKKGVAKKKGVR
jgi:ParB/RepB/Spo0J family partition protein